MKCKYLINPQEIGSPLYKCAVNNDKHIECYGRIKEKLSNNNVFPNGECPFAYRNNSLSDCPFFEQ